MLASVSRVVVKSATFFFFAFAVFSAAVLCGCRAAETPLPTSTISAPTRAPAPTVAPATNFNSDKSPAEIADAYRKTLALQRVRYKITSLISYMQNGAPVQQPGLNARGAESGSNRSFAISGIMNTTGEPATFEFITLDNITYVKGLSGIPGVQPDKWYKFPPELGNFTRDAPGIKTLLADLKLDEQRANSFAHTGSEALDGHACDIWLANDSKLAEGFIGIANNAQATEQLQAVDGGQVRVWTCDDGYLHRLTGSLQGHAPDNSANKATMELDFVLFDHNVEIPLTAPPGAQDFQVPATETEATATP